MNLPATIPLFPLPNVVLFPGVAVPLHIFEPRYRDMVHDAAESNAGMIGMVLLRDDWQERYHDKPEIFALGCAGQLEQVDRLEDGRYNIVLRGVREFRVQREIGDASYRQAQVSWREAPVDQLARHQRSSVRSLLTRILAGRGDGMSGRLLGDDSIEDEMFVNLLCFGLDFPPMEKQALLEASALHDRAARLCEFLQFALSGAGSGGSGSIH